MDLSQPNVALHIHTAQPGVKRGPHLAVQKRHVDNLYNVRVENMEEIDPYYDSSQQYQFTACLKSEENDISSIKQQIDLNVQSALDGFNSALMIMSSGQTNNFSDRSKIISYAFTSLKSQILHLDEYRRKKNQEQLTMEYAYLGVTDDCCYDLRNDRRIKNEVILQKGIDSLMKGVHSVEQIWERVKLGSKFPFILKVRLSDNVSLLGHLVIVDLLNTRFVANASQVQNGYAFHESCQSLRETVKLVATPNYIGLIPADVTVLTKTLATYLGGMNRVNAFLYVEEYPEIALEETLIALDFAQHLQRIPCRSVRNHVDSRLEECQSKADYYKERYHKAQLSMTEIENNYQALQAEIERNQEIIRDNSKLGTDAKIQLKELFLRESELQMKNRNLEYENTYLRCLINSFEADIVEQGRQQQKEAVLLKFTHQQAISEVEKLDSEMAENEQKMTDLVATLNHKSQQLEELEVFQKQAKLLLSEADGKYSKMVKYYERKESDTKEVIQKEQARWYEKKAIMQNKIQRLQSELEQARSQSKTTQEDWTSNQQMLQPQVSQSIATADESFKGISAKTAVTSPKSVVTVDDIAKLKSELQKQADELKIYKARMDVAEANARDMSPQNQIHGMQEDMDQTQPSIPVHGSNVAKENIVPPSAPKTTEDHETAVRKAESKEIRLKAPSKKSFPKPAPAPHTNTREEAAEIKQGTPASSEMDTSSKTTNSSAMLVRTEVKRPSTKDVSYEREKAPSNVKERSLSPELLVDMSPNRGSSSKAPTTTPPITENANIKKPTEDKSKSKQVKKRRKLGTRKTTSMPRSDGIIDFDILPEEEA